MRSNSARLALTSPMIVAPGSSLSTGSARMPSMLVTPDNAALRIDCAEPVTVAVERQPEVEAVVGDDALEVFEIGFVGRVDGGWESCRRHR